MTVDPTLKELLKHVFEIAREPNEDECFEQHRSDFVFHMTDWQSDLEQLREMYVLPQKWDPDSAAEFLIGFLYHVIPHLNAAGKLLVGTIADPFSEGEGGERGHH